MNLLITDYAGNMGTLKPGARYMYEKVDGVTYATESGSQEKTVIGYDWDPVIVAAGNTIIKSKLDSIKEDKLWGDIRKAAKDNPALQKAMEQCIIVYHLSKDKPNPPDWHPV